MDEHIVLGNDLSTWAREIERVGLLSPAQVVKLEDEVLWEICFISPDNPTYTCVH